MITTKFISYPASLKRLLFNRFFIFFVILTLVPEIANAGLIGATWNNAWYPQTGYQIPSAKLATCFEGIDFFAENFGPSDNFSFFTNIDYTDNYFYGHTNELELNNLYLQWEDSARTSNVRLGRQFVVESPLPLYLDGVSAKTTLGKYLEISALGGMKAPPRWSYDVITTQTDSIQPIFEFQIGPAMASGTSLKAQYCAETDVDKNVVQFAGATFGQDFHNGSILSAEFLYDLTHSRVERAGAYATIYLFHALVLTPELSADNRWSDSLFNTDVLLNQTNLRAGMLALWKYGPRFEIGAGYWMHDFYSLGISNEMQLMAFVGPLNLDLRTTSGYGGNSSILTGELCVVKKPTFKILVDAEAASITYSDLATMTGLTWTGSIATEIFPSGFFNSRIELQAIGNPYEKIDMRVLLQTTFTISRFFK